MAPKNVRVRQVTNCAVCSEPLLEPILHFPRFPLAGMFCNFNEGQPDLRFDMGFCLCPNCGHGQLNTQVDPDVAYGKGYTFKSSSSPGQLSGIDTFFSFVTQQLTKERYATLVELGCNDLQLLRRFRDRAEYLFGIDPTLASQDGQSVDNIKIIGKYAEDVDLVQALEQRTPDVVICRHTIEHIPEPKKVIGKLIDIASPETLFVFEFPSLDAIAAGLRYNQIFHEHIHYWTGRSFAYLLEALGCNIERIGLNCLGAWTSLMISFRIKDGKMCHIMPDFREISEGQIEQGFALFKDQIEVVMRWLDTIKREKVCGYGAAVMPPILAYHMETDFQFLDVIWDDDEEKDGLWYPNLPVQIRKPQQDLSLREYHVLITEPDAARPIMRRLEQPEPKQIIVPRFTL